MTVELLLRRKLLRITQVARKVILSSMIVTQGFIEAVK